MPTFEKWYAHTGAPSAAQRAVRNWGLIQRNPTSITIDRKGVEKDPQTVRTEYDNDARWIGEAGLAGRGQGSVRSSGVAVTRDLIVFGVRDHPTVTDTDLKTGDQFAVGKVLWEIRDVVEVTGGVQARAERLSS